MLINRAGILIKSAGMLIDNADLLINSAGMSINSAGIVLVGGNALPHSRNGTAIGPVQDPNCYGVWGVHKVCPGGLCVSVCE